MSDYEDKANIMKSVLVFCDSGYTIPQGREVASYYFPLEYGIDGMIRFCEEKKLEVAGFADGDGILGMKRLYFYEAARIVLGGIQQFWMNYVKELRTVAEIEPDAAQKEEYLALAEQMEWIAHNPPRNFREALHLTYLIHITVLNEDAISGYSPGRLGQVLIRILKKILQMELLQKKKSLSFWKYIVSNSVQLSCSQAQESREVFQAIHLTTFLWEALIKTAHPVETDWSGLFFMRV